MKNKLFWFIFDRRKDSCKKTVGLLLLSMTFFWTALYASTGNDSLNEHAQAIFEIDWKIIGVLFTISGAALSFIYISGQKATRAQITAMVDELKDIRRELDNKRDKVVCMDIRNECHKHFEEIIDLIKKDK